MKLIIISLLTLLLGSCSPVYIVDHDLEPPKTANGLSCLKGCQSQLNQCDLQCNTEFSRCSIKAKQQAKKLLPGLLKAYPNQLQLWRSARSQYRRDLDWYEFQSRIDYSRRQSYLRHCIKQGKNKHSCRNRYGHNSHYYYDRPSFNILRPVQPTLASETTKLVKTSCHKECSCKSKYRLCYTSCGGVVKSKKICIKNCP
jgi:hypothetical protein